MEDCASRTASKCTFKEEKAQKDVRQIHPNIEKSCYESEPLVCLVIELNFGIIITTLKVGMRHVNKLKRTRPLGSGGDKKNK